MTDVSVLTLVKNRPGHLRRLIEGVARSRVKPRELIVVDMSDTPVEPPSIAGVAVKVVSLSAAGLPLARARNLAARHAEGGRLLFLDVDCIPMADLVGAMDAELARSDALVCFEVRYLGADAVDDGWTEARLKTVSVGHPVRAFPAAGRRVEPNAGLFWSLAFGIRRASFEAVGGFDERYVGYGAEDTDFGFRCRDAGLPLMFASGSGAFHQHHGVVDPPLQHFEDIVSNAHRFHQRWGFWPMEGWLRSFAARGLVAFDDGALRRLRSPTEAEISAARAPADARF